jgi:hypothetical protein
VNRRWPVTDEAPESDNDDVGGLEVVDEVTAEVGDDGTLVVDEVVTAVDRDGVVVAADETMTITTPDGTVLVDEVVSVANEDGRLVRVAEEVEIDAPSEGGPLGDEGRRSGPPRPVLVIGVALVALTIAVLRRRAKRARRS